MASTLKLPVGIDSFEKIRRNNFYYIDKTKLIEQLVETGADESLFDGLYIAQNKALCE